jgi:hypothetical protein
MIRHLFLTMLVVWVSWPLSPARAAFHLWQVKEVFSNADGTVQFVELFDNFNNEHFVSGHQVRSTADGVNTTFTIPSNLPNPPQSAGRHMLLATPGFAAYAGVTPDYTLPANFINLAATNYTISFVGVDSFNYTAALLPDDGVSSITDTNLYGVATLSTGLNSPTNFQNQVGFVPGPGDYNRNKKVDAADFVVWRKTLGQTGVPLGSGADGNKNGTIDAGDFDFWAARFGDTVPGAGSGAVSAPEPATLLLLLFGVLVLLNHPSRRASLPSLRALAAAR